MMTPTTLDSVLQTVLMQLIRDLAGSDSQYMIAANYYEHQTEDRFGERWHIAQIWVQPDSVGNLELTRQGLLCDVRLNQHDRSQVNRILLPYSQIWKVQKNDNGLFTDTDTIYYRIDKLNLSRPGEQEQ